jgi:hypothetical protein
MRLKRTRALSGDLTFDSRYSRYRVNRREPAPLRVDSLSGEMLSARR